MVKNIDINESPIPKAVDQPPDLLGIFMGQDTIC
jgi:hypothetical protein